MVVILRPVSKTTLKPKKTQKAKNNFFKNLGFSTVLDWGVLWAVPSTAV